VVLSGDRLPAEKSLRGRIPVQPGGVKHGVIFAMQVQSFLDYTGVAVQFLLRVVNKSRCNEFY
jgi:hypothetical protein